ncbi:MAG TPA: IS66 family transposase [Planktothrix sp.]|jgi:transposase
MVKSRKQPFKKRSLDAESLESLDKKTLVDLVLKTQEQLLQLTEAVQTLMREKYGPKTERFHDPDQLTLFGEKREGASNREESSADSSDDQKSDGKSAKQASPNRRRDQNPKPSTIERIPVKGTATNEELTCQCCSRSRSLVNEVTRASRYAYRPASVVMEDFTASVYACAGCGDVFVVEPKIPAGATTIGADEGLICNIAVDRFEDSLPLTRQERRFNRLGAPIAKSTMCGWLSKSSKRLRCIYDSMKRLLLMSKVIASDDSPMKVLDRTKARHIKIGRVWIYRGDEEHPVNLFDFTSGRGRAGPIAFLSGFKGYLLGDCFSGNQALCAETGCIHVACHAHARRYFIQAELNNKVACAEILAMYSDLFEIERVASDLGVKGDERKLMRDQEAKPLLHKMKAWLDLNSIIALPKSSFGKAINYCLNNWTELTNYLLDGDLRIDNNLAEQEMKRVAINRKNSLFFGSDRGGEDAEVWMCRSSLPADATT